ncbi:MAG: ATP-binding protein [Desulfatibacillaceae bacterium]
MTEKADNRVLVVDDEKDIREGCERILSRMGCEVRTAGDGETALSLLESESFDLLLLDLKMPGADGADVLDIVREKYRDLLVIVITGYATVDTAIDCMKRGAYDFIPKPFEPAQLRIAVDRALDKLRLEREARAAEQARQRTLADLGKEQSRIRTIIEALPSGLVVTNPKGEVVLMNPAFRRLLDINPDRKAGDLVEEYVPDQGFVDLAMDISRGRYADPERIPTYEFAVGEDRYLLARGRPVPGEGGRSLGAVILVADVTAQRIVDRLKTEFVGKVAHELRSPLSTVHEQLAMVLSDVVGAVPEQDQHMIARAKEKTQGLITMIGDLLDLSRIESGQACGEASSVDAVELLSEVVEFLRDKAKAKWQTLVFEPPEEPLPSLRADPMALESVFGNLITNAINYTQEGGRIQVRAWEEDGAVKVSVADNGFGMEQKHLDRIFEKFYRVKTDRTRRITGTGLGLSIVKGIVDSLGGAIEVESEPDVGTTFTVSLPVAGKASLSSSGTGSDTTS